MVAGEGALQPIGSEWRVAQDPPTLLTSTSIREQRRRTSPASRRTCDRADRSATNTSTCPLGSLEFVGPFEPGGWKLAGTLVPLAYIGWSLWLLALGIGFLVTA
jgi:hypothetical protein